jgi:hypothetical protein
VEWLAGAEILPAEFRDHAQRDGDLGALGIEGQRGGLQPTQAFAQMGVGIAGRRPADCLAEGMRREFDVVAQGDFGGEFHQLQPDRGIVLAEFLAAVGDSALAEHGQHDIVQVASWLVAIARVEQSAAEKFIRCAAYLARPEGQAAPRVGHS